jgi:hypothetical protein
MEMKKDIALRFLLSSRKRIQAIRKVVEGKICVTFVWKRSLGRITDNSLF